MGSLVGVGSYIFIVTGSNCDPPVAPVNGHVTGTDFSLGRSVVFSCNPNYMFKRTGTNTITKTCRGSRGWGRVPKCVRKYSSHDSLNLLIYN